MRLGHCLYLRMGMTSDCRCLNHVPGKYTYSRYGVSVEIDAECCVDCGERLIPCTELQRAECYVALRVLPDHFNFARKALGMSAQACTDKYMVQRDIFDMWADGVVPPPTYVVDDLRAALVARLAPAGPHSDS